MDNLNIEIKDKILNYLKDKKYGASSSDIAKETGHNRITVTKYLEIMNAHKLLEFEVIAQAKLWRLAEDTSKKRILIVDDEPHIVDLIKLSLMNNNYKLLEAYSGFDALDKAKHESPDLIILDLMMPSLNGYEVCQRLKQGAITQNTPILILSAKGELKDKLKGINVGADDYMTKPFDPAELEARSSKLLILSDKSNDINSNTNLPGKISLIENMKNLSDDDRILKIKINKLPELSKRQGYKISNEIISIVARMILRSLEIKQGNLFHMWDDTLIIISQEMTKENIKTNFRKTLPFIKEAVKTKSELKIIINEIIPQENISDTIKLIEA